LATFPAATVGTRGRRRGPTDGYSAGGLGPDEAANRPMAAENEVGRPMEASSLLPKPPAATVGLALAGVKASGEERWWGRCLLHRRRPELALVLHAPHGAVCVARYEVWPRSLAREEGKETRARRVEVQGGGGREEWAAAAAGGGGDERGDDRATRKRREGGGDDVDRTTAKILDDVANNECWLQ
jgi:hypothetical protein